MVSCSTSKSKAHIVFKTFASLDIPEHCRATPVVGHAACGTAAPMHVAEVAVDRRDAGDYENNIDTIA